MRFGMYRGFKIEQLVERLTFHRLASTTRVRWRLRDGLWRVLQVGPLRDTLEFCEPFRKGKLYARKR